MDSVNNKLSNLSYTNKDFNSIYTELLQYAKDVSYKWDPAASDESDPGVVLLKLAAIIGDKDSYNIDKNVLELMPASVTQLPAARQIFEQCGYSMPYYRSATGNINFKILESEDVPSESTITIPAFVELTDVNNSVTYVTTQSVTVTAGSDISIPVIEGQKHELTVNNDPLITLLNLDSKNRIYIPDKQVAENGIFIQNTTEANKFDEWYRVTNIETQPRGSKCYKFGLTSDGRSCYIEFPDDADTLIGEGVYITYIVTSGSLGNVPLRRLKMLKADITLTDETKLTNENVLIFNPFPITNGRDPESIAEAYKSYNRVKDTFDTLVSLKDYNNYMRTSKKASNGFVCDRTNDVQRAYKIKESFGAGTRIETKQYVLSAGNELKAFDLAVYALKYINVTGLDDFNETFNLDENKTYIKHLEETDEIKSLQHDFVDYIPNEILFLKNKYSINSIVIPRYKLSLIEQAEVQDNIYTSLSKALNSQEIDFGTAVPYDLIYDTILYADDRIKAISVEYPRYETWAVYMDSSNKFNEVRVDSAAQSANNVAKKFQAQIIAKNILSGVTPLYEPDTQFTYSALQTDETIINDVEKITTETSIPLSDNSTFTVEANENILLYAPNFVEENSYSSYVKVVYDLSGSGEVKFEANNIIELKQNDFIIFLWKAAESDSYYTYYKYGEGSLVSASFALNAVQIPDDKSYSAKDKNKNSLDSAAVVSHFKSLKNGKGKTSDDVIVVPGSDVTETDFISQLVSSNVQKLEVLVGTNVIKIHKPNKIFINNKDNGCSNIYWVRNNNETRLFPDGSSEYILKNDEYLLYTDATKSAIEILGQGTKLETDNSDDDAFKKSETEKILSWREILEESIDSLDGLWKTLPLTTELGSSTKLYATEMQQHQLGENTVLTVSNIGVTLSWNDAVTEIPNGSIEINFIYKNSEYNSIELKVSGETNKVVGFMLHNSYKSLDVDETSLSDVILLTSSSEDVAEITKYFNISANITNTPVTIYPTMYTTGDGTETKLPDIVSSNYTWQAISLLNLNTSNEYSQKLTERQKIWFHDDDETCVSDKHIQSSYQLNMVGGESVKLPEKTSFMYYTYSGEDAENFYKQIKNSDEPYELEVLPGDYLLHLQVNNGDAKTLKLEPATKPTSGYTFKPLLNSSALVNKTYVLNVSSAPKVTLNATIESSKSSDGSDLTVMIEPLYRFNYNSNMDAVIKELNNLDTQQNFNYTSYPDNAIKDPLKSESFHDIRHFYNKFTIDQWITPKSNENPIVVSLNIR